jgi:hypothetical protein
MELLTELLIYIDTFPDHSDFIRGDPVHYKNGLENFNRLIYIDTFPDRFDFVRGDPVHPGIQE